MFLTCFTYRQATWNPDCSWQGPFGSTLAGTSNESTFQTGQTITSTVPGTPSTATIGTFQAFATFITQRITYTVKSGSSYIDTGNGQLFTTVTAGSTININSQNGQFFAGGANVSSSYATLAVSIGVTLRNSYSMQGLTTTQTFVSLATLSSGSTYSTYIESTTAMTSTVNSTSTTTRRTWILGTLQSSSSHAGSTTSTSASSSGIVGSSTISSTITGTIAATVTLISTHTQTTSVTVFEIAGGTASLTTTQTTTTAIANTTGTISANTTLTQAAGTPAWWGWSSERGTLLLATGNTGTDDYPLWLEMSNWTGSVAGLWNFSGATQTTLWPSPPTATTSQTGTIQLSAAPPTTTITLLTQGTFTWFGSSTTAAATGGSSIVIFSESETTGPVTAAFPQVETSGAVTSWANLSTSQTGSIETPVNTTTTTYIQVLTTSGNYSPDIMTVLISTSGGRTTATVYSLTTLTDGYFTTSVASGSPGNVLTTTGITTAHCRSVTTSQSNDTWVMDWSNPIETVSYTSSASISSSTVSDNQIWTTVITTSPFTPTTTTNYTFTRTTVSSSYTSGGTSNEFTQNLFATPYLIATLVTALSTTSGQAFYQAGSVGIWSAIPSQQAFADTASPGTTYRSASITDSSASMLASESGHFASIDSISGPIKTTSTGLWIFGSSPSTNTTTTTTTTTTNATQTNSTTSVASTSVSWTGPAVTYTSSVTSTFMESAGFTIATSDTHTESFLGTITQVSGTITNTSNYISTITGNSPVTWTQNTTAGTVFQFFPGAGGTAKLTTGAVTLNVSAAAVSLSGPSTTWSTATPNFLQVVIGGSAVASASALSSVAGLPGFTVWTIPGIASVITSPAYSVSTCRDRFVKAITSASQFFLTPPPFLLPRQATAPMPAQLS